MTAFLMQVSASTFAQKITLNEKEASLVSIFEKINKQSGVDFLVNIELLSKAKPVSINVNDEELAVVLDKIFKGQPLEYSIKDKAVVVTKKTPSFLERVADRLAAIDVHGRVVDQEGKPLPGATVKVKGTGKSVSNSAKGEFYLEKVEEDAVLIISFIGYVSKEVIAKRDMGNIALEQRDSKLDEVQVIAYGTTTRRLSTGNISSVKAEDIEKQPINNPILALSGRVTGITVTQSTGLAGAGVKVRIQGQNSMNKGNDPYYVIDGVPFTAQLLPTLSAVLGSSGGEFVGSATGSGNPLSYINPADIESIEVLKDADATAIYGSRAANGAILITTKKGKAGQTKADITMQSGIGNVSGKMKLLNTQEYLEMRHEAYKNDGIPLPTPLSQKNSGNYDLTVWDKGRNTDWQKELIGGNAHFTDIQTAISGGNAQTTFRLNGGYHRETTVFPSDLSDVKGSVGINLNHNSNNKKFKIQFSANYLNDNNQLPTTDLTGQALKTAPNAPALYMADGSLNWARIQLGTDSISTWQNPLADLLYSKNQTKADNLLANASFAYQIFPGLNIKTSLGYTSLYTKELTTGPLLASSPESREENSRSASYGRSNIRSWIIEPQINYQLKINKGQANFLIGSTFQQNNSELEQLNGSGYNSDLVLTNYGAAATLTLGGNNIESLYKYNALFGRFNYNWNDKYIFNITARRDGSSRFGYDNQFHNFGAVGAAWIFSNEEFVKGLLPVLSFGKLRGSYGTTGNDQIGEYQFLSLYEVISGDNPYQGKTGLQSKGLNNPYLQWELTKKFQLGVDIGFLKDKILINTNYFHNRSSNQLLAYALPNLTGYNSILRNFPATVGNTGWEILISGSIINKTRFTWSSSFNITLPKNTLVAFPGLESSSSANTLIIGKPLNIQRQRNFGGVNSQTGLYQFYAADGTITAFPKDLIDYNYIFQPGSKIYGGFQNTFRYRSFQLDVLFQGVKQDAFNNNAGFGFRVGQARLNQPISVLGRWQNPGDEVNVQKFSTNLLTLNAQGSSISYSDASYIRLKNLSISWEMPQRWQQVIHFKDCKFFLHGQNLWTLTKYNGLDPETLSIASLPTLKLWTLGIQLTF